MNKPVNKHVKSILEMTSDEARDYLLKPSSYCSIDIPEYFTFAKLLSDIKDWLSNHKQFKDIGNTKISNIDKINYRLITNKDGKYAWRPLELCNPVLYVELVNTITVPSNWGIILDRFKEFQRNPRIQCYSIPGISTSAHNNKAAQILQWWEEIEQQSLALALDYNCVFHTDITDCYGSLYTHSIAWALHGKQEAKTNRNNKDIIGNKIDKSIQNMRYGQTNGIPQGSVLMDFIAEMVLGYIDRNLSVKLNCLRMENYQIIRYRDDYRIFVHNSTDGELILKELSVLLYEYGLKLNVSKTIMYPEAELIRSSIKKEKLSWISKFPYNNNLQKNLLIIHQHAMEYPNSGSLHKALQHFSKRIKKLPKNYNVKPFISIIIDIAIHCPKLQPTCIMVLSNLFGLFINQEDKKSLLCKIRKKFSNIPNIGYLEIWLQRLTIRILPEEQYDELLCRAISAPNTFHLDHLWNFSWISNSEMKTILKNASIVDSDLVKNISVIIKNKEVNLFDIYSS